MRWRCVAHILAAYIDQITKSLLRQIADRLCASIGQDILDCLFSRSTLEPLSRRSPVSSRTFKPFFFFILALAYTGTFFHSRSEFVFPYEYT